MLLGGWSWRERGTRGFRCNCNKCHSDYCLPRVGVSEWAALWRPHGAAGTHPRHPRGWWEGGSRLWLWGQTAEWVSVCLGDSMQCNIIFNRLVWVTILHSIVWKYNECLSEMFYWWSVCSLQCCLCFLTSWRLRWWPVDLPSPWWTTTSIPSMAKVCVCVCPVYAHTHTSTTNLYTPQYYLFPFLKITNNTVPSSPPSCYKGNNYIYPTY